MTDTFRENTHSLLLKVSYFLSFFLSSSLCLLALILLGPQMRITPLFIGMNSLEPKPKKRSLEFYLFQILIYIILDISLLSYLKEFSRILYPKKSKIFLGFFFSLHNSRILIYSFNISRRFQLVLLYILTLPLNTNHPWSFNL